MMQCVAACEDLAQLVKPARGTDKWFHKLREIETGKWRSRAACETTSRCHLREVAFPALSRKTVAISSTLQSSYLLSPTSRVFTSAHMQQVSALTCCMRNASRLALLLHTLSPPKEPSISRKRALHLPQKKKALSAKEPYISRAIIRVLWGGYD